MKTELTQAMARQLLEYDPHTGKLTWRKRTPDLFAGTRNSAEHSCKRWNTKFSGKEAFTAVTTGYKVGAIFAKNYLAHRVIWLLLFGHFPDEQIDHINGDRTDNRLANLRAVTNAENCKNQCARSDNTTGVTGVYWFKRDSKWVVSITANGKQKHLGYFDEFEDAVARRKAAEAELGFHPNHGRAAA